MKKLKQSIKKRVENAWEDLKRKKKEWNKHLFYLTGTLAMSVLLSLFFFFIGIGKKMPSGLPFTLFVLLVWFFYHILESLCYRVYISPNQYRKTQVGVFYQYLTYPERIVHEIGIGFMLYPVVVLAIEFMCDPNMFDWQSNEIGVMMGIFSIGIALVTHYESIAKERREKHKENYLKGSSRFRNIKTHNQRYHIKKRKGR